MPLYSITSFLPNLHTFPFAPRPSFRNVPPPSHPSAHFTRPRRACKWDNFPRIKPVIAVVGGGSGGGGGGETGLPSLGMLLLYLLGV